MQMDLTCPVENRGVIVKNNSQTGEPYALFKLFNLSDQVIQSVLMVVCAYDAYGGEVGKIQVALTELAAEPKSFFATNKAVSLAEYPEAKHFVTEFREVQFEESEPYTMGTHLVEVKITEPDAEEQLRLVAAAGEDACCYAKDEAAYWLCVCGRPNIHMMESCIRCGRDKDMVLSSFSSRDAITRTLEEQERIRAEEEAVRLAEEARLKAERIKQAKKVALLTVCAVAMLAALYGIGCLVYSGVSYLLGNSALEKNDYSKAYGYYAAAGSSEKIATFSEEVRGNTIANLLQLGVMTADNENLYFIDNMYSIYKENKATGERTRLGEGAGVYLNVSGDWLYYVDAATGQAIRRISKDGQAVETVFETTDAGLVCMTLVGNELYFSLQEPRKDITPEMQELVAQTGNTSVLYQYRLYRQKVGGQKAKLVSDEEVGQFSYFKDKIYFINSNDAEALYEMDRNGKNAKKLVSGPVYYYGFSGDNLYYIDGSVNEETGQPKLSIEKAKLTDGAHQETMVADTMTLGFAFEGEDLYYLAFHEGDMSLRKKTATEDVPVADSSKLFNMIDGYLLYVDADNQFMKSNADKSAFEPLVKETEENTEPIAE